ncbi:MAG: hypothetical protein QOE01_3193 [Actinomycetota bacterium]|jgi:hypothetical protein|nr:hypothetical protein [Actinomycetota bacterium]
MSSDDSVETEVVFKRFPLRLAARSTEHHQDLFREFALLAVDSADASDTVPGRLLALIEALGRRYQPQTAHEEEREQALARGEIEADLSIRVPASAGSAATALGEMLDEADEFCRAGDLLTLAAPDDSVEFRRWYLGEIVGQLAGRAPTPWPGDLH